MTPELFASLVNLGAAGAVIIVVVLFLKFTNEQRSLDRDLLKEQRALDRDTIKELVANIERLTQELINLRKDFDIAVAAMRERTRPRPDARRRKPNEGE
jgi:hypothetical protein